MRGARGVIEDLTGAIEIIRRIEDQEERRRPPHAGKVVEGSAAPLDGPTKVLQHGIYRFRAVRPRAKGGRGSAFGLAQRIPQPRDGRRRDRQREQRDEGELRPTRHAG